MLRASFGTTLALLGALGATAAGSLTANASPAAEPPADTFTVVSAGASAGNPDQLTVVVDSPSTVVGLTAKFLVTTGADAFDQVLTQQSAEADPADSTQTESTWTATIPAGTSGLPIGNYTINLGGTFTDSASYTASSVAAFYFHATSSVTLAAANTNLSYGSITPGLSGTVTLTYPDGAADTDYTGVSVELWSGGQQIESLPIASDGTYSDPNYEPATSESIVAEVNGYGVAYSQSASVALTVTNTKPTLLLKVNPVTETYGRTVIVTGTLTYMPGSTSEPLSGQEIWIGNQQWDWGSPQVTGTTGTDGSFSITLPAQQIGTTLYVGTTNHPGISAVETPLQVNVVNPTVISGFKVALNQYWTLSVSGCLGFASGNTAQMLYHTSGLTVQYASSANGPWKNLFAINGNEPTIPAVPVASSSPARTSRRRTTLTTGSSTPEPREPPATRRQPALPSWPGGTPTGSPPSRSLQPR